MKKPVKLVFTPEFKDPSMIAGWQESAGDVGQKVVSYLNRHIQGQIFGEIEPDSYFHLGGVRVENNIAVFPASNFYTGHSNELVLLDSNQPQIEIYDFLERVLDVGEHFLRVKEIYTINSIASQVAHTGQRKLMAVFNQAEFQKRLRTYGMEGLTWEGPPSIDSYLLWLAEKRDIPAVSIWPEVAFYLSQIGDPRAARAILAFFDQRFGLNLDYSDIDREIQEQDEALATLAKEQPEAGNFIRTLEIGIGMSDDEQLRLSEAVNSFIEKA